MASFNGTGILEDTMTDHEQSGERSSGANREADEALRRSEEVYRVAAELADDLIYDWDMRTDRLEWRGDIDRHLGYRPGEFPRTMQAFRESIHPDDRARVMASIEDHLRTGRLFSEEYRIATASGAWRIWTDRGRPLRDDSGRPWRWIGIAADVTEQRTTEGKLRSNEERFYAIIDQMAVGMVIASLSGELMMVNRKFCDIVGYTAEELQGSGITPLTHPDDRERTSELFERMASQGTDFAMEKRYIRRDGRSVWVYNTVSAVRDAAGYPKYAVALVLDIDHQKQVEQNLREHEQQLRMALETGRLGSWQYDLPTGLFDCSATCKRNFGLDSEGAVAYKQLLALIHPEDREQTERAIRHALLTHDVYEGEYRVIWPDGGVHWIAISGRGLYQSDGRPFRMVGVTLDITPRKIIEEERQALLESERASRAEAERANRMKEEFLATLSHELRTPLNAILGWSQLLRAEHMGQQEVDRGLEIIERNARVQTQIIEDLLDMSRIISGKVRLQIQQVDILAVIESALETMRPAAQAKRIRVQQVLDPGAGQVLGDPGRLQQVAWNLLSNAIKFTPGGGKVQIVLACVGSHVELRISDTGSGIKPEFLPHVFERFRQADASTTRTHGGLGLGLAIVKNLVELHGGTVQALSDGEGRGATFVVKLPLTAVRAGRTRRFRPIKGQSEPGLGEISPSTLSGIKVLVVDDEPDARELIRRVLGEYDAEVMTVASAEDALSMLGRFHPDVLVSDIGMPGQDGYDFIRNVRKLPKECGGDIPAIALTAFARSEDRSRALISGFQTHVAKPVEPAELVTVIASLAGRIEF